MKAMFLQKAVLLIAGATAIFPPGTVIADSAIKMLEVLDGDDGAKTAAE